MLICGFFILRHSPHHHAFSFAFYGLLLVNSGLVYTYNADRAQPDTLIHLFPASPDHSKETPNS
jgi:hypothetical protein